MPVFKTEREEIRDLNELIRNGKRLLVRHPDDNLLALSVEEAEYRKRILLNKNNDNPKNGLLDKIVPPMLFIPVALVQVFRNIFEQKQKKAEKRPFAQKQAPAREASQEKINYSS